jgi:hypothetical protein
MVKVKYVTTTTGRFHTYGFVHVQQVGSVVEKINTLQILFDLHS